VAPRLAETPLPPAASYPLKALSVVQGTFRYAFSTRQSATVEKRVRLDAVLEQPGLWRKEMALAPEQALAADGALPFEVDVARVSDLLGEIQQEVGATAPAYEFSIQATVGVTSASPALDDTYVQSLSGRIETEKLSWLGDSAGSASRKWTVGTRTVRQTLLAVDRVVFVAGAAALMVFVLLLLFGALFLGAGRDAVFAAAAAPPRARETPRVAPSIVDVSRRPASAAQGLVELDSMEQLIQVAETLGKPILHVTGGDRQFYYVQDQQILYELAGKPAPPAAPD
jgi:hypothetical protein